MLYIFACRTFSREITTAKLGITSGERFVALDLIQKLAYSTSKEQYAELYQQLQTSVPTSVVRYYDSNWHSQRGEWCLGLTLACHSFMNTTNNRLERLNGQLKQLITDNSSLEEFLDKFYVVVSSLRNEHDHKTALQFQKARPTVHAPTSVQYKYMQLLTTHAADFVLEQLALHDEITGLQCTEPGSFQVDSHEGTLTVSAFDCECLFRKSTGLPCRHIFAVRQQLGIDQFEPNLCLKRWLLATCRSAQRLFSSNNSSSSGASELLASSVPSQSYSTLSAHQKYQLANKQVAALVTQLTEVGTEEFHRRLAVLQKLHEGWRNGAHMTVVNMSQTDGDELMIVDNNEQSAATAFQGISPPASTQSVADVGVEHTDVGTMPLPSKCSG